jgi:spermidine/putrescine transport system substrate-binding protein
LPQYRTKWHCAEPLPGGDVDPVETTLLAQTPLAPAMRDRTVTEFENIKSGF